jgi:hypothetical protein
MSFFFGEPILLKVEITANGKTFQETLPAGAFGEFFVGDSLEYLFKKFKAIAKGIFYLRPEVDRLDFRTEQGFLISITQEMAEEEINEKYKDSTGY